MIESVARHLVASGRVRERLAKDQQFNAYHTTGASGAIRIGIGPVTDFYFMAQTISAEAADLVVDALRAAFDQPPALCSSERCPTKDGLS